MILLPAGDGWRKEVCEGAIRWEREMSSQIRGEATQMFQAGDLVQARHLFVAAILEKPQGALNWFWLLEILFTDQDKRETLRRLLRVDPSNLRMRRAFMAMEADKDRSDCAGL